MEKQKQTLIDAPSFSRLEISETGHVELFFSEVIIPLNYTVLNKKMLDLQLESRTSVPENFKSFTWSATSFTSKSIRLNLHFERPLMISSERKENRDQLVVTILQDGYFVSAVTKLSMVPSLT